MSLYKQKEDIIYWLEQHKIKGYNLIADEEYGFVVDTSGDVDLSNRALTHIKVKFNIVKGNFNCSKNALVSLEGCPYEVGFDFYAHSNLLNTLEHCPYKVGGEFYCNRNNLRNLEFCPQLLTQDFVCHNNPHLGSLQNTTDFKIIYNEHLHIKAKKDFFEHLNNSVDKHGESNHKVKI